MAEGEVIEGPVLLVLVEYEVEVFFGEEHPPCDTRHAAEKLGSGDAARPQADHRRPLCRLFHPRNAGVEIRVKVAEEFAGRHAVGEDGVHNRAFQTLETKFSLLGQGLPGERGIVEAFSKGFLELSIQQLLPQDFVLFRQQHGAVAKAVALERHVLEHFAEGHVVEVLVPELRLVAILSKSVHEDGKGILRQVSQAACRVQGAPKIFTRNEPGAHSLRLGRWRSNGVELRHEVHEDDLSPL